MQLAPAEGGRSEPLSPDAASWRCEESGAAENLWLNLSTGYVGGGRDQSAWGGPKGSNGALHHFEATGKKYPLVVKLGTISATGAELYSYAADEDGPVLDAKLAAHLKFWGINALSLAGQHKRAKFPTSKAPISAIFHSFRLIFGRAIIFRNGIEAWALFP